MVSWDVLCVSYVCKQPNCHFSLSTRKKTVLVRNQNTKHDKWKSNQWPCFHCVMYRYLWVCADLNNSNQFGAWPWLPKACHFTISGSVILIVYQSPTFVTKFQSFCIIEKKSLNIRSLNLLHGNLKKRYFHEKPTLITTQLFSAEVLNLFASDIATKFLFNESFSVRAIFIQAFNEKVFPPTPTHMEVKIKIYFCLL